MEALLKASEASALMGVSMRHVRRMAQSGALSYQIHMNAQNRPEYLFPLSSLPDAAQQKYFAEHAPAALPAAAPAKAKKADKPAACKPLEAYTAEERGEIGYWISYEHMDRICEALDCDVSDLLERVPSRQRKTGKDLILEQHGNRKTKQ